MTAKQVIEQVVDEADVKESWVNVYLIAMKRIAEMSFEAGFEYSKERSIDHMIEISNPKPDKEQFIKTLFPDT